MPILRVCDNGCISRRQAVTSSRRGGGLRGAVEGFSKASSRRLREVLCRYSGNGDPWALTLTLPYDVSPGDWRDLLERYRVRLSRLGVAMIWRVELTRHKRPHIHGVVYGDVSVALSAQSAWWDVSNAYAFNGGVEFSVCIQSVKGAKWWHYVAAHTTKHKVSQLGWHGRQWGILNKKFLHDSGVDWTCTDDEFFRVIRVLRRVCRCRNRGRGAVGSSVWFCRLDTLKCLFDWSCSFGDN